MMPVVIVLSLVLSLVVLDARPVWGQIPVVGHLWIGSRPSDDKPPYVQDLATLGQHEGRTFLLEARWAEGDNSRFPALARDLLKHRPAVIFSSCGPALRAIRRTATALGLTVPTSFLSRADEVLK